MAWAYYDKNDPKKGQYWVDPGATNAIPDTVPLPGHDDPADAQQMTGSTPDQYRADHPEVVTGSTTPTTPTTMQWGTNRYEGWDPNKIAANSTSPKYQVGRVLSNFDPRLGITPDVLAALNALGIGTFEGSGQNLRVVNASPEFEGYTDWGDMIHGYQGGAGTNAAWQYGINNSRDTGQTGGYQGTVFPAPTYTGAGQGQTAGQQSAANQNPFASHPAGGVWIPSLNQWVPGDHPLAQTAGAINVGSNATLDASSASGTTSTMPNDIQSQARTRIMELLQTPRDVDPEQLRNSPEMQAVQLMAQRAEERDRAALAERAAAEGWSGSGGFEGGLTALREGRGEAEMQFMGQLAVTQMERQREDLQRGIEFALNQGQFDLAQQLEREMKAIDAAIAREQIAANVGMNDAELAVRERLGIGDLDLRRYLGQIGSAYDFANLDFQAQKYRDDLIYNPA